MGDHAADGLVEDASGGTEVEGTATSRVVSGDLAEVGMVLDCIKLVQYALRGRSGARGRTLSAEEFARDVESLAANDNNLLAVEKLLSDGAGKATEQVTLAVNDNLLSVSAAGFEGH